MLIIGLVLVVFAAVIVALLVTQRLDRRRNPRQDSGLLRAGDSDAQSADDAANSAINKASWMRPGGF